MIEKNNPGPTAGKPRQFHCHIDPRLKKYRDFIQSELAALLCHLGPDCPDTLCRSTLVPPDGELLRLTVAVKGDRVVVLHPTTEREIENGTFFDADRLADGNINWPVDDARPGGRS